MELPPLAAPTNGDGDEDEDDDETRLERVKRKRAVEIAKILSWNKFF